MIDYNKNQKRAKTKFTRVSKESKMTQSNSEKMMLY